MNPLPPWWLDAPDAESLARGARLFARHGHVVLRLEVEARGLPPPLPAELHAAASAVHARGFLVRRAATRGLAALILGQAPEKVSVLATPSGAPIIASGALHVSFSARGAVGLVAMGRSALGVDLEPALPPAGIAWNMLRPDEQEVLRTLPAARRDTAFLSLWRAKEACLKAAGCGLLHAPETVAIVGAGARIEGLAGGTRDFSLKEDCAAGLTLALLNA